jgi:hypothetical protein
MLPKFAAPEPGPRRLGLGVMLAKTSFAYGLLPVRCAFSVGAEGLDPPTFAL